MIVPWKNIKFFSYQANKSVHKDFFNQTPKNGLGIVARRAVLGGEVGGGGGCPPPRFSRKALYESLLNRVTLEVAEVQPGEKAGAGSVGLG